MTSLSRRTALSMLLALAAAAPGLALAQAAPGTAATPPAGQKTVRTMFASADRNKNWQLTRAESKGRLPITYSRFKEIDTAQRGWISFEQFVAFTNKRVGKQADDTLKIGEWL